MEKIKHWFEVCSQGKEGENEQKFFFCLARDPKKIWKTIRMISMETTLNEEQVEKIINKYLKLKMIVQNPDSDYEWAYYERIENKQKEKLSITEENQIRRIKENQ